MLTRGEPVGGHRIARQDAERPLATRVDDVLTLELHNRIIRAGAVIARDVVEDRTIRPGHVHDHRRVIREVAIEHGILSENPDPVAPGVGLCLLRNHRRVVGLCRGEAATLEDRDLFFEPTCHGLRENLGRLLSESEGQILVSMRLTQTIHLLEPVGDTLAIITTKGDSDGVAILIEDPHRDRVVRSIRIDRVDPEGEILTTNGLEVNGVVARSVASAELTSGSLVDGETGVEVLRLLELADACELLLMGVLPVAADDEEKKHSHVKGKGRTHEVTLFDFTLRDIAQR